MPKSAEEMIDSFLEDKSPAKPAAKKSTASADNIIDEHLASKGIGLRPRQRALTAEEKQEKLKGFKETEEATREPGLLESAGKGITAGTIGIAEDVGTITKYIGTKTGSETMTDLGDNAEKYWQNVKEEYEAPETLQGDIIREDGSINTELLTKGSWWAYHVAQMVPSLAVSVLPAAATIRGISGAGAALTTVGTGATAYKALKIGKNVIKLHPKVIDRLARIGGAVAGGAAGGALEGSGTYREVLERGGTPEEAASAAEQMFFASGALNAISLDFMFKRLPNSAKGRIFKRFLNGATEGVTEYLEGPVEGKILLEGAKGGTYEFTPEEFGDKIRQEANVFGPAFVLGMIMPVGALSGSPKKEKPPKEQKPPPADPARPTGVTVTDEEGETIELSEVDQALKEEIDLMAEEQAFPEDAEITEEIVMEATPEEQMETAIDEVDTSWGNTFEQSEYGDNWNQEDRDTFDLLYEAADFNPAVVDEIARMAEVGENTENINNFLIQTIQEGYNARIQEAQSQQQGQVGSDQVSGEPGAGLQPAGTPATTGGPTAAPAGGPETAIEGEPTGDRPAEPIAEPVTEELTDGETPVDELEALADEEIEAQLEEAELEQELIEAAEEEPAIEEMDEADIEALLMDEGEAAAPVEEPAAEAPETTGGPSAKPTAEDIGKAAPEEEAAEPGTEKPQQAAPAEEGVGPEETDYDAEPAEEPAKKERKYTEGNREQLKGKTVTIEEIDEGGATEVVVKPADEVIADIDNRLTALEAFRKCMAA